jgi:gentisate 1,2-dioxygenase
MTAFEQWLQDQGRMKHYDPERELSDQLVTGSDSAQWLDPAITGNPAQIGVLLDVPARTMEFYLQQLAPGVAGDLQRHRHESVHYVIEGEGHTEIGPRTVTWHTGDLVYTPPWVWHRHYNDGAETARMLLVENSPLLELLGLNQRESAGEVTYAQRPE